MSYKKEIILNSFQELLFVKTGLHLEKINHLKAHASERNIYRLQSNGKSFIGIYNENVKENLAFVNFSRTFLELGLLVPEIINVSEDGFFYIEEDLGDMTLYEYSLKSDRNLVLNNYDKALTDLLKFQILAKDKIDYGFCYQTKKFDETVIRDDIKKFSDYYLVKYSNDLSLINDIENVTEILVDISKIVKNDYFLYRDFQPRNIMIKNDEMYYIDYQSGRKGPLQYDVASFLYSGSINLNEEERSLLLSNYETELDKYPELDKKEFRDYFYYFTFMRLLQVLGSYGYIYEKRNDLKMQDKISKALSKMNGLASHIENETIIKFIKKLEKSS